MSKIDWNNPEDVKEYRKEYRKLYYQKNREKLLNIQKERYYKNIEEQREYQRKYYYEHGKEKQKAWKDENREKSREYGRKHYQKNKEKIKEYHKKYYQTHVRNYKAVKSVRARYLLNQYIANDEKHNRGKCTITEDWIVDNILNSKCHYCGETDWTKLGCDRINNDLPHTHENCVPCCRECNLARQRMSYEDFLKILQ